MTNSLTTGPGHLTFDQVGDLYDAGRATSGDVFPCECWLAGNAEYVYDYATSWPDERSGAYEHPEEFESGVRSRFEQQNDL